MKNSKFILIFILLLSMFSFAKSNGDPEKDYFKTAKYNEAPKNVKFSPLMKTAEFKAGQKENFVVIYSENFNKDGVYIKCYYNKNVKVTRMEYFSFDNSTTTKEKLTETFLRADTSCEVKCDREKGCYDKPTEGGVLLCAFECMMSCA